MIGTLIDLLGNFYARNDLGNFEAITRSLLSAIPDDQVSLQFLGLVYFRTGRTKDAIRIFDKVASRLFAIEGTGNTEAQLFQVDHAAAVCYQEATRPNPDLALAWHDLGIALLDLGKYEQAILPFRSALIAQPNSTSTLLALGQTALRIGDLATAEECYSRLCVLEPNNNEAYLGLGQIYRKRRDFATAHACFIRSRLLTVSSFCSVTNSS